MYSIFIMIGREFFLQAVCLGHLKAGAPTPDFTLHRDMDLSECWEKGENEKAVRVLARRLKLHSGGGPC